LLISIDWLFAQSTEDGSFDQAFLQICRYTAGEHLANALRSADSLFFAATNDTQKIRSLMLISDVYHHIAKRDSSIYYAVEARQIAEQTDNYLWQARINGVLSAQHREMGLYTAGRQYAQKGLKVIEKVRDHPELVNQFKGQSLVELGIYDVEEGRYDEALTNFRRAEPFFSGFSGHEANPYAHAQNCERIGLCHLQLGAIDSAAYYYRRALTLEHYASRIATPLADTSLKGLIYNGLGQVFLADKEYSQADSCFQGALAIAEATGFYNLKIAIYKSLVAYYQVVGNADSSRKYTDKYVTEIREQLVRRQRYMDLFFVRMQHQFATAMAFKNILAITVSVIFMVIVLGIGLYIGKQRTRHAQYRNTIRTFKSTEVRSFPNMQTISLVSTDAEKELMPESKKKELLKKLDRFESSRQFTDRNISVAVLAGKMKTNTKYLSYIINNFRNKDFNSYINELRINYIIARMDEDNRYLNYKISYLAEECGFATHSQFTTVFKNITGLSPSAFILFQRKAKQKEETTLSNKAV